MRSLLLLLATLGSTTCLQAQSLTDPNAIMALVAANQDRSQSERAHYLYLQHAKVVSHKGQAVRCEEITDIRVTPSDTGSHQELLKLDGRLLVKHQYEIYHHLPANLGQGNMDAHPDDVNISFSTDDSSDRDLVEHMRNNFINSKSRDGIGGGLFPLTSQTQADYLFHLLGRERMNGREVFHLSFEPRTKDEFQWKGDAYIDTTAYQPVLVRTAMARKLPFAVRTLLGTSLPGLGFTVTYAPQPGDIWFPVTFGTEFKLRVLFFYNRQITIDADNRDFERTHVSSTIVPLVPPKTESPN